MRSTAHLLLLACAMTAGCASTRRPPDDLDLGRADVVQSPVEPTLSLDGPSGKGVSAGTGALKGGGAGFAVGTVACLAAGPFFPLCLAAVLPTSTTVGAATWATVSGVRAESAEAVDAKRDLLKSELAGTPYSAVLATNLQRLLRERQADGALEPVVDVAREWQIEVALSEVEAASNVHDQPFAIRLEGRLTLRRSGQARIVYESSYEALSEIELTTAQWRADDAAALRNSFNHDLMSIAGKMRHDLAHATPAAVSLRQPLH